MTPSISPLATCPDGPARAARATTMHACDDDAADVPAGDPSNEPGAQRLAGVLAGAAILIVDDEPGICNFLHRALAPRCALVEAAGSAEQAEALRLRYHFDLLLVDIRLPGLSGLDWLSRLRERGVRTPVIYMTAYADMAMSIQALRHGAGDFIIKPFRIEAILQALGRSLVQARPAADDTLARLRLEQARAEAGVIGESDAIRATLELVRRVAPTPSTVLIEGESGTGKALIARTVHALDRRDGPFVAVDCGTLSDACCESELFGQARDATAGARTARDGLIVQADRGTLSLERIDALPFGLQARLLRVLETGRLRAVGAAHERSVDVRVVATTHRDLGEMVQAGEFREDLHLRLRVLPIRVPPLRERSGDLPLLIEHFVQRLASELGVEPIVLMHTDHERLRAWHWPGNVRELRMTLESALLLGRLPADSCRSTGADAPARQAANENGEVTNGAVTSASGVSAVGGESAPAALSAIPGFPLDWPLDEVERAHMQAVLVSTGNNKSAAARVLGVSRKTLERKQQLWERQARASENENEPCADEPRTEGARGTRAR